eukprot:scaffold128036_cov67-Phaeocystis_antarctica.AAC.1
MGGPALVSRRMQWGSPGLCPYLPVYGHSVLANGSLDRPAARVVPQGPATDAVEPKRRRQFLR